MVTLSGTRALRALAHLGTLEDGQYAGAADIAERVGAPANYLGKLLRQLTGARILESRKGKSGGFRLARRAGQITLYDVLEPLEKVSRIERCILGSGTCGHEPTCALHEEWSAIRDAYLRFLRNTHLGALAAVEGGHHAKEATP